VVRIYLKKKEENCEELESEIVSLIKDLDKSVAQLKKRLKFENIIEIFGDIINCKSYPFIKTDLGYDSTTTSLPTSILATAKEVLFVAGGVQIGFLEEQPIVDCVEHIDEMHSPHMLTFEHSIKDDIFVDITSFYNPINETNSDLTSFDQPKQNMCPIIILTIKIKGMTIMLSHICRRDMKFRIVD
jgi:hypothetical protein